MLRPDDGSGEPGGGAPDPPPRQGGRDTDATHWLLGRWPAAIAVAMAVPGFVTDSDPDGAEDLASSLGSALMLLPLAYLVLAKLRRRRATWPVVIIGIATVAATRALELISPAVILSALALVVLLLSLVDGQLQRDRAFQTQAWGMAGFAAVALAGLALLSRHPDLGTYVVAAGWLLHGIWDLVYLKLDKVVARSFAEWCAVIDILLAVQLVLLVT